MLEIWKAAPIQWDSAENQQGDFKRWWIRISEARKRPGGMEHIGLTANILWQVWKERNKKKFENQNSCSLARTIDKAHKEWLEQEEIENAKARLTTRETISNHEEQHRGQEAEGTIILDVSKDRSHLGLESQLGCIQTLRLRNGHSKREASEIKT